MKFFPVSENTVSGGLQVPPAFAFKILGEKSVNAHLHP
jgi:hypothetical protein